MKNVVGFTLIELIIVIAIIGVLASVILPRLQGARDRGQETRIVTEMEAFHKNGTAEEFQAGTFDVVCGMNGTATATALLSLIDSLQTNSDDFRCNSNTTAFAASAQLNATEHWCVDSTGNKGEVASALAPGATVCP